tara:strand:- start:62 stop:544 length:483 start_codon:yes stop_codon:yes gene_type:complete
MRLLITAIICSLYSGCALTPKQAVTSIEIEKIEPRYIETEQFKRISEYMTGRENLGDRVILRTQPEHRAGYYFILVLDNDVRRLPNGTVVIGEFYTSQSLGKQTHEFTLPSQRASTDEIFVGLTGEDWPEKDGVPAAWRFTIKDANGAVLGEKQSYLWSL